MKPKNKKLLRKFEKTFGHHFKVAGVNGEEVECRRWTIIISGIGEVGEVKATSYEDAVAKAFDGIIQIQEVEE